MADRRPDFVFIMTNDHAAHAIGLAEMRAELGRLSDEVGDVAPADDLRRRGAETRS